MSRLPARVYIVSWLGGIEHAQVTAALDRDIEFATGLLQGALPLIGLGAADLARQARSGSPRPLAFDLRPGHARIDLGPIEQVFEVRTIFLEARRVDVRQVVGDHIELRLHCLHAGGSGV